MSLYYHESGVTLYHGDALTVLHTLPDESVQCCVTSPPYFGLRDYGTGTWEGGSPVCDHLDNTRQPQRDSPGGFNNSKSRGEQKNTLGAASRLFTGTCGICGAIRIDHQLGLEPTPEGYMAKLVAVFREVKRILKKDGVCWLNLGDSYSGSGKGGQSEEKRSVNWQPEYGNKGFRYGLKPKDLIGIPWLVAFALRADGWYLRSDIIWQKKNCMPESVRDRPTRSHEYLFLLAKSERYYYDAEAIREPHTANPRMPGGNSRVYQDRDPQHPSTRKLEPLQGAHGTMGHDGNGMRMPEKWNNPAGRNKRSVWTIATVPFPESHFATFPPKLIEPCILAGSRAGDVVLDPFLGSGTAVFVAKQLNRQAIGIDLNADYLQLAVNRLKQEVLPLS